MLSKLSSIVTPLFLNPDGALRLLEVDDDGGIKANFVPFNYTQVVYGGILDQSPASSPQNFVLPATVGLRYCITYVLISYRQRGTAPTTPTNVFVNDSNNGILWTSYLRARGNAVDKQVTTGFSGLYIYGSLGGQVNITYNLSLGSDNFWVSLNYGGFTLNV